MTEHVITLPNAAARAAARWAWDAVDLLPREISLIKAMASAHPEAFTICVEKIARSDAISFAAGGEDGRRATDFAEGMRFVARQMCNARDAKLPTTGRGAPPSDLPNS